jgi:hypothetical protein
MTGVLVLSFFWLRLQTAVESRKFPQAKETALRLLGLLEVLQVRQEI